MPQPPLKICAEPGCNKLSRAARCDRHKRATDSARPSAAKRGYNRHWAKARALKLARSPLCVLCLKENKTVAASCVDHIIPHRGDMAKFWDETNWQTLCDSCHSRKTAKGE